MANGREAVGSGVQLLWSASPQLDALVPLFDQYRQFYGYPGDLALARGFLQQRLERGDSRILLACLQNAAVGFVQCYPGHASLECRPSWLVSDLFVTPAARGQGVAQALLSGCHTAAEQAGCCLLELFTARDNRVAQRLYEAQGYREDTQFLHYELPL